MQVLIPTVRVADVGIGIAEVAGADNDGDGDADDVYAVAVDDADPGSDVDVDAGDALGGADADEVVYDSRVAPSAVIDNVADVDLDVDSVFCC